MHRDLASRNVLLDGEGRAKVCPRGFAAPENGDLTRAPQLANFALCRRGEGRGRYEAVTPRTLPVRWMAPETLKSGVNSESSDVWSFGVLCWECFSLAALPYSRQDGGTEILTLLEAGGRLERPAGCPRWAGSLMQRSWTASESRRPTFSALRAGLDRILQDRDGVGGVDPFAAAAGASVYATAADYAAAAASGGGTYAEPSGARQATQRRKPESGNEDRGVGDYEQPVALTVQPAGRKTTLRAHTPALFRLGQSPYESAHGYSVAMAGSAPYETLEGGGDGSRGGGNATSA